MVLASSRVKTTGGRFGFLARSTSSTHTIRQGQDLAVEEEQRRERLCLRGGGHLPSDSQVGDEGGDIRGAEFRGVSFAAEKDVLACPADVSFLGADTVVARAHGLAHLREQT
jgi:hypothetical protein